VASFDSYFETRMLPPGGKSLRMSLTLRVLSRCLRGLLIPASLGTALAQTPAFPGAEGFGAHATGGRGGDVYRVTNLNSSGAGSLRYGIENAPTTGRTIVFGVSGYIPISNNSDTGDKTLRLVRNKITIAGQTAPGDGIGLKDGRILLTGNNEIIRNLRIRHGKNGGAGDCLNIESNASNSIVDHVTMQFSTDENISFFNGTLNNFTMQSSVSAWGLETHNAGGLWDLQNGSCHHSLWAHHKTRNPKARPSGLLEWVNNVTFDWGIGFIMGDSDTPANWKANVIGSYFLAPPAYRDNTALENATVDRNGNPNFSLYLNNCRHDSDTDGILNGTDKGYTIVAGSEYQAGNPAGANRYVKATTPFPGASGNIALTIDDPLLAFKKVVSDTGAVRMNAGSGNLRDEVDTLLFNNLANQVHSRITRESDLPVSNSGFGSLATSAGPVDSDVDGMPDVWESALGFNPSVANHNAVFANNGTITTAPTFFPPNSPAAYTQLEEYLHFLTLPHAILAENTAAAPTSLTVDLRRYTSGFTSSPVFAVTGITGGTIEQFAVNGTTPSANGPVVKFTPSPDTHGRAGFSFNVTDAQGSSWTRPFAILVSAGTPPVSAVQLNVDCGSGAVHASTAAAPLAGKTWNSITAQATSSYTLNNAIGANGGPTACDVTIASSGSTIKAWNETTLGNPNPSALMSDYLYGNTYTVTVTDLPAGNYQLYVYAHGDAVAQASTVTVHADNGGGSATAGTSGTEYRNLGTAGAEGYSYLKFQPVVGADGTLVFTVSAYLNGFQLLAEPKQNLFVNITTANGNTGATHLIPAVNGWGYSAAAPVPGEIWNVFNETNYNATFPNPLNLGQIWNIVSNVSLASADGTTSAAKMAVDYHAVSDVLTSDRLSTFTGVSTNQSGGVMDQLMRNYWDRNGVGNFQRFTISGLAPSKSYLLYVYGASAGNTGTYKARVDLDRDGTVDIITNDPSAATDPNSDALFTYGGNSYSLTPIGQVWNKGVVTTDASGVAAFDSRAHLNGFQLVAYQPPAIVTQPSNQLVHPGEEASFSVTATADPDPTYQWLKNGWPIPGATDSSYTIPTSEGTDAGDYAVVVSNAGSSVTSSAASLGLIDPYGTYISSFGLDPETTGAPDANPDSDGLANSLEFFLGTSPTAPDLVEDLPAARVVAGGIEYVFRRFKGASDTAVVVEYTSELSGEWTPALNGVDDVTMVVAPLDATYDRITVTIPTVEPKIFVRLRL
jgi:hypothetical protein